MPTLTMCKGLPGCGKSTYATEQQREHPDIVLISRDDLRRALHSGKWSKSNEKQIVDMENAVIFDSLARGRSVIVHDTNLAPENETRLHELARAHNAQFIVKDLIAAGETIVYCSGREDRFREDTEFWIRTHIGGNADRLFMRPTGDMRKDSIVKVELYNQHIKGKYNIRFVLDDRAQVVDAWRLLGLTVLQVAEGKF